MHLSNVPQPPYGDGQEIAKRKLIQAIEAQAYVVTQKINKYEDSVHSVETLHINSLAQDPVFHLAIQISKPEPGTLIYWPSPTLEEFLDAARAFIAKIEFNGEILGTFDCDLEIELPSLFPFFEIKYAHTISSNEDILNEIPEEGRQEVRFVSLATGDSPLKKDGKGETGEFSLSWEKGPFPDRPPYTSISWFGEHTCPEGFDVFYEMAGAPKEILPLLEEWLKER